jgi:hypothetical protein
VTFIADRFVKKVTKRLASKASNESADTSWMSMAIAVAPAYLIIVFYAAWRLANAPGPLSQEPFGNIWVFVATGVAVLYGVCSLVYWIFQHSYVGIAASTAQIAIFAFAGYL